MLQLLPALYLLLAVLIDGERGVCVERRKIVFAEIIHQEIQNREYTGHITHIIVRQERERKERDIDLGVSLVDDILNAEYHEREIDHGVYPHHVPIIRNEVAAHCIKHAEGGGYEVVPAVRFLEVIGECSRGEGSLGDYHAGYRLGHILVTEEKHYDGTRAGKIIEVVAEERRAETRLPRIDKALQPRNSVIEFGKERAVLMVKIHAKYGRVAEREKVVTIIHQHHYADRAQARRPAIGIARKEAG